MKPPLLQGLRHLTDPRVIIGVLLACAPVLKAADLYVAANGSDTNSGAEASPFQTLARAQVEVRGLLPSASAPINVWVRGGTYRLGAPLVFGPSDSGTVAAPVKYSAFANEIVTLSGAVALTPTWTTHAGSILVATIGSGFDFDMLTANGSLQIMARYPNYNAGTTILDGHAADAISATRAAAWTNPSTGFVRAMHNDMWGGNSFKITGKDGGGNPIRQWVGDNNRGSGIHSTYRMVENIFQELDSPGEWFYDKPAGKLYFYPPVGLNAATATFEGATLEELVKIVGTGANKVKHLTFDKFTYTGTHRTLFTRAFEPLLRGDWCVVRAGAVFMQDAENITISNSKFDRVGGNAVFISGYNRNHLVTNNEFLDNGATCVNVVGLTSAVRYPSFWPHALYPALPLHRTDIQDTTPGPLTDEYPKDCTISYNHMFNMGRFEKQVCGVNLSMSESITVSHNTIHRSPRSGINVNDGTWGGHIIEFNDLFDCVRESGDHGPFNSWGRDRFWSYTGFDTNGANGTAKKPFAFLDAWKTIHLRNNRLHYSSPTTWGIDLDDGSSNYEVYNNLCLNTGYKLREGFGRKVYNNIFVNERANLHVWFDGCADDIHHNIVITNSAYSLTGGMTVSTMPNKQATFDYNVFYNNGNGVGFPFGTGWKTTLGYDSHSLTANPLFTNPAVLDYSVQPASPALTLGFVNFPMNQFGKPGAPTPAAISGGGVTVTADPEPLMGASATSIYSESIKSVVGIGDSNGVFFETVPAGSYAANQGFLTSDVIRVINGTTVTTKLSFWAVYNSLAPGSTVSLTIRRNQTDQPFSFIKIGGTETLNDTAGAVFTGVDWVTQANPSFFNGDSRHTRVSGDFFEQTFHGTGVDVIAEVFSDETQIADVYIDNVLDQTISTYYGTTRLYQQIVYSKRNLSFGLHTVKVVNRTANFMFLDAVTVFSPLPPNSPSGLVTSILSGTQIGLNWLDNGTNETAYTVERSPAGANTWTLVTGSLPADSVAFTDSGLTPSTAYDYRVKATGPGGSSFFATASGTTLADAGPSAPLAPTNLVASASPPPKVQLTWTDNSSNETGFAIERSVAGTNSWVVLNAALPINTIAYTDSGSAPSTQYYYRVQATGTSGPSTYAAVGINIGAIPPAAPSGLGATALSSSQIQLTWTDNSSDETGFAVERSPAGANTWTVVASPAPNSVSYIDGGLNASTAYDYRVKSIAAGASSAYITASATTLAPAIASWTGGGADSNWLTSANWTTLPVAGDALSFGGNTRLSNTNNFAANTLFGGITFNSGSGAFVLAGNAIHLGGPVTNAATALETINLAMLLVNPVTTITAASGNITIGGVISDGANSHQITKLGAQTLTLNVANTFKGGMTLSEGTVGVGNNAALGTGAIILNGGRLQSAGSVNRLLANSSVVANSGTTSGLAAAAGDLNLGGLLTGSGTISISNATAGSVWLSGNLGGFTGTLSYNNILNGNNLFVNGGADLSGAKVVLSGSSATGSRRFGANSAGNVQIGELSGTGGIIQAGNNLNTTYSIGQLGTSSTYSGVVQDLGTGKAAINKVGAGTLTLAGASGYTGGTTISGGTLIITNTTGSALGNGAVSVQSGATLGGTGTIVTGATTVSSGGILAPGLGGTGTLNLAGLTLNSGVMNFELGAPASSDKIALTGAFSATGVTTIQIAQTAGFTLGTYPLITGATGISASSFAVTGTPAGYTGNLSVSGNVLNLVVTDTTPPVITVPANITSTDPVVSFTVTALDAVSGAVTPVCTPPSGSTFPVGTTTVQCTATDASGNQSSASFTVTVTSPASVATPSITMTNGNAAITIQSESGKNYQLQRNYTLAPDTWENIGPAQAGGGLLQFADSPEPPDGKAFYRVLIGP